MRDGKTLFFWLSYLSVYLASGTGTLGGLLKASGCDWRAFRVEIFFLAEVTIAEFLLQARFYYTGVTCAPILRVERELPW